MLHKEIILIIDFGSQFTQLITRRVREAKVYSEIHPHTISVDLIKSLNPKGIILSGGPMSVYDEDAPSISTEIFNLNVPILGICYGLQFISKEMGGVVEKSFEREYGRSIFKIEKESALTKNLPHQSIVWMSHGDIVKEAPDGFQIIGVSDHSPVCAIENKEKNIYGLQFHPEVYHTEKGEQIIKNFLYDICGCEGDGLLKILYIVLLKK